MLPRRTPCKVSADSSLVVSVAHQGALPTFPGTFPGAYAVPHYSWHELCPLLSCLRLYDRRPTGGRQNPGLAFLDGCPPQRPDALTRRTWSKSGDVSRGTCRTRGKRTRGEWRSHSEWGAVGTRPRSIELRRLLGKIRTVETARTLPLPEQFVPRVFHACIVAGSTTVGAAAKFSAPPARHTAYASGTRQLRYTAAMRRRMALPQQLRPFMVRYSACVITVSTVQYWRRWLSGCMKGTLKGLRHQMSWLTLLSGWPV